MLISVREAYKYAREHIEGDRLAPLSPLGVEDFGEHPEKTPVCYCRTARTSFNTSLLLSKGFRDAYGLSGGFIGMEAGRASNSIQARRVGRRRRQALRLAVIVRSRKPPPWLSPGYRMRWQCFPAGR